MILLKMKQLNYGCDLIIHHSQFTNIHTQNTIIYDGSYNCQVDISSSEFRISFGSVYLSNHNREININVYNNSVISYDQLASDNEYGLFNFLSTDHTFISDLKLSYIYNISKWCINDGTYTNIMANISWDDYDCSNPVMAIYNAGEVKQFLLFHFVMRILL